MGKEVKLDFFDRDRFHDLDGLYEIIHMGFDELKKQNSLSNVEWLHSLNQVIQDLDTKKIYELLTENISMDFDFAKELKLFDTISCNCLTYNNLIGKGLIEIMRYTDCIFIVSKRRFMFTDLLDIELSVCHIDFESDLHDYLIGTTNKK
jgi:hypothetical protein